MAAPALALLVLACHRSDGDAASCAGCHAGEAAGWAASRHAHAADNPAFERSFADTRPGWCHDCHRPDGVGCGACHAAEVAAADTCAACHEFELPHQGGAGQHTVSEWASSAAGRRGQGCVTCHDPHTVPGAYDDDALRAATSAAVRRSGDGVSARITVAGAGHAVPTGDPFRRLTLELCADLACRRPVGAAELGLRFTRGDDGRVTLAEDTRLRPSGVGDGAERTVAVAAPGARAWRLWYHRLDPDHEADVPDSVLLLEAGWVEGP